MHPSSAAAELSENTNQIQTVPHLHLLQAEENLLAVLRVGRAALDLRPAAEGALKLGGISTWRALAGPLHATPGMEERQENGGDRDAN